MAEKKDLFEFKSITLKPQQTTTKGSVLIQVEVKSVNKGGDFPYDYKFDYAKST